MSFTPAGAFTLLPPTTKDGHHAVAMRPAGHPHARVYVTSVDGRRGVPILLDCPTGLGDGQRVEAWSTTRRAWILCVVTPAPSATSSTVYLHELTQGEIPPPTADRAP